MSVLDFYSQADYSHIFKTFFYDHMPKSRKRHHSRSKSRSHSRDRSRDRDEKHKKIDSHDRDGKRRKIDSDDSPQQKRSVSSEPECPESSVTKTSPPNDAGIGTMEESKKLDLPESESENSATEDVKAATDSIGAKDSSSFNAGDTEKEELGNEVEKPTVTVLDDPENKPENEAKDPVTPAKTKPNSKKNLTPQQLQKKVESEKKKLEKQREKEEKDRKRNEEKEKILQEKLKKKEEKQKEIEMKQKEKEQREEQKKKEREEKEEQKKREREEKEEQKRKEKEEKELKRKEKEEKDEQKKKEKEQEKIKKQQEMEEKNKEKLKEEEKKQKAAAAFVSFFVPKKADGTQEERKNDDLNSSLFMAFEVKSDMKMPPLRRNPLVDDEKDNLDKCLENPNESESYLQDLKSGKTTGRCVKTWPFEDFEKSVDDDDVVIVEENSDLGQTICENETKQQKFRAKFLQFHDNRRPAYYGTWRKKSKSITARRPFAEDNDLLNYEEDSDDDWEEEEQGESLKDSDEEADKENEDEKDDYDIDNEFFVPHGHLSDDEIDDEEKSKLSPESLKQKLKLLKDEFDLDRQSKTHKLKPRFVGCVWYKKNGSNVEEAIHRYLQPLAIISNGQIQIKKRSEINLLESARKTKPLQELNPEYIPMLIKVAHGNQNRKRVIIEQYITYLANNGITVDIRKSVLLKNLKEVARWEKCKENGPMKNKFCWYVSKSTAEKYNVNLQLPNVLESENKP